MSAEGVFDNPNGLNGRNMYDQDGDKIGTVSQVYVGDHSGRPEWVTVKTGWFGMKESLVPLTGATRTGEDIHVPYAKETVKEAPRLDADEHLDPGQEKQLYRHYGLTAAGGIGTTAGTTGTRTGTGTSAGTSAGTRTGMGTGTSSGTAMPAGSGTGTGMSTGRPAAATGTGRPLAGVRGSMPADGRDPHADELIRSEEQVHITTEEREVGHARLRKVVVTENVTTSVPLSHEEVRVVHEPISSDERTGIRGSRIGEAQTEVTLHADQPVIRKESVPVERVRLETEKVTEQREISTEVRKEQIEYDNDLEDKGKRGMRGGPGGR
jgi:stress response protein YsnF/sporulation protein YlmC with PRC-barrel domain